LDILWLLFAHYIGDTALQSRWQADNKAKSWYVLLCHCMIWAGLVCVALEYIGILVLWKAVFLIGGHFVIDTWKCSKPKSLENKWMMYVDQASHLVQLVIVYVF